MENSSTKKTHMSVFIRFGLLTITLAALLPISVSFAQCTPSFYSTFDIGGIKNVTMNNLNWTTAGTIGYCDYRGIAPNVNLVAGSTYNLTVSTEWTGTDYSQNVYAYFDWNQNNILDDAGEEYYVGNLKYNGATATISVTVPIIVTSGLTTMRIRDMSGYGGPCGKSYGEAEDYSVNINNPPMAICKNVTISAGASCNAYASIDDGSYDPDGDPITLSQNPAGPYSPGATSVTLTITDNKNASSSCTATVTVIDDTPPSITCPQDIVTNTDAGVCTAVVAWTAPSTSDNCGTPTVVCTPASGSIFNKGTTTVTCTATDGSNNTASCSFNVTVNDNQNPSITCPQNIVTNTDACESTADVTWAAPSTSDNCGTPTVVCTPVSGSIFNTGVTTVTCTATDGSNNTASCSFTVTVQDPVDNINLILSTIASLPYGIGVKNQLKAHPNVALIHVGSGNLTNAIAQLLLFIVKVNDNTPPLTASEKQTLIEKANTVIGQLTGCTPPSIINDPTEIPVAFTLTQNYPNPFGEATLAGNPSTVITYTIPVDAFIVLDVEDNLGRKVAELVNGFKTAGHYEVMFDARELPNGIYFYRLHAGQQTLIRKMAVMK